MQEMEGSRLKIGRSGGQNSERKGRVRGATSLAWLALVGFSGLDCNRQYPSGKSFVVGDSTWATGRWGFFLFLFFSLALAICIYRNTIITTITGTHVPVLYSQ